MNIYNTTQVGAVDRYVRAIRNANKRAYAAAYARWLQNGGDEPDSGPISYMAAQAVRMTLDEILTVR